MAAFLAFVEEYWLTFLFGLIATVLSGWILKMKGVFTKGKETLKNEEDKKILKKAKKTSEEKDLQLLKKIQQIDTKNIMATNLIAERLTNTELTLERLRKGVLSLQGKQFKNDCRYWLQDDKVLTLDKYTELENEHEVYNSLGGNHEGDVLFNLIEEKYKNSLK